MISRRDAVGLCAASLLALGDRARAQPVFPSRTVRFIVPVAAGGSIDGTSRIVANRLSEIWGHQVVVENKPGAGNNIAVEAAARSEPDGYTALVAPITLAVNRFLYPALTYDTLTDFAPVSLLVHFPNMMVVPNSSPAHSVKEFIAYAKANPGKITYASGGSGSSLHLAGELFKRMAGIEMTQIPYRGAAPAFNDLIPGRVDAMFNLVPSSLPLVRQGQLRALAVTTAKRLEAVPDLPTVAEAGVPGFEMTSWLAMVAPAKTPKDIIEKISRDAATAMADSAVRASLERYGVVVVGSTPAELGAHLRAEMDKWGPIIKAAGITSKE
jgi:tripartite-type tricarboxylate transporter receptor subunit TctC